MSHELRTPLNSIIGFSRMMLKGMSGTLSEMMEQDLSTIHSSGNHLLTVINDILDQAKINAGKMTIGSEEFDLKPELEAVRAIGLGLVKDKQIDLRMEVAHGLPKTWGDKVRIRQVLLNLVSNASKFTRQGTITIHAYPVMENGRTWARVDVIDTGIGIDPRDIDVLFEPFRQVDSSLTRTAGGTGLGLPIARSLMELMGGTLNVTSEMNVGSTFSVTISTEAPAEGEQSDQPDMSTREMSMVPKEARPSTSPLQQQQVIPVELPKFILIVEDNPEMVDQYRRALQRESYEVIVASTMLEARAVAPAMQPTIIVMDVNFENGEGWDLLSELKNRDDTRDIPIIVGTLSDERERAEEMGAFAFLQRPYSPDVLTEAVTRAVKEANIPRVLLIDDQDDALRLLGDLLRTHGNFRVYTAHNGVEGLQQVAIRRPQLIILDLRMPEMDGFAVLQELRQNPETSGIPVMVVTSDDTLKPEEQLSLASVNVLMKTAISQSQFAEFISGVSENLHLN
jgi:CheY-like chemotaxis protein